MKGVFHPEDWMKEETERRKELWRALWRGDAVDHIPIDLRVVPPAIHPMRSQISNGDLQLEVAMETVQESWKLRTRSDWIPAMRPDVGCSCLATAFGASYYWGESPHQTPGIKAPIIRDIESEIESIPEPEIEASEWLLEGINRIRLFADSSEGFIPVSLLDAAGALNVAADLLGVTELLISLHTAPEAVHRLLGMIQRLFVSTIEAGISAAGGEQHITTTDFPDFWFPEGRKGHVSDDISANFGPETYDRFSAPYHAQILQRFGAGGLHNCGPNPCHRAYVEQKVAPRAIDLSDAYSHDDLPLFHESLSGRGFIYLSFDNSLAPERQPVDWYRTIMLRYAPDLIVVPVFYAQSVSEGAELFNQLRPIAKEYASRMRWGWWRDTERD